MRKYLIIILLVCFSAVIWPQLVFGSNPALDKLDNVATKAGPYSPADDTTLLVLVQSMISVFLSVIGVLLLVYLLYAGYNWLTAQGEEEKVTKAKETIQRAIIGVIIIVAAYAISVFVIARLEKGTLKGASAGKTISFISTNQQIFSQIYKY